MSQQALNLRRSVQIVRRHRILVAAAAVLGILAGGAYAKLYPPMMTSTALVVLPQPAQSGQQNVNTGTGIDPYTATQEVIADSTQVLSDALPNVRPSVSLIELRKRVQIGSLTSYVISVSAEGANAADAEATANAVAHSYISYIGSADSPVGRVPAQLLQPATSAVGLRPLEVLIIDALIGAISGTLIGAIVALTISRGDRRLRERDEIANSIGVPVLASFPVAHPSDAAGWTKLLEDYKPGAMHALQLRTVLHYLGTAAVNTANDAGSDRSSVTVLSLSSDSGALALGPQLAAFAASQGIPTVLVIGPQQDPDATATLRTACAAPRPASSKWPGQLQVTVSGEHTEGLRDTALTVVVMAVNGQTPRLPDAMRSSATLLGVSSGAATAEQLARAAVSADADGREIIGILVADPELADQTTGRIPQLSRPSQRRLPTRLKGMITELRR
jgi:capsular polysaccharide biosynthesis protein